MHRKPWVHNKFCGFDSDMILLHRSQPNRVMGLRNLSGVYLFPSNLYWLPERLRQRLNECNPINARRPRSVLGLYTNAGRLTLTTPQGHSFLWILYCTCRKRVQQGDRLPLKLFTAALEWIMKSFDWNEISTSTEGKFLSNLCFANDIVVFWRSASETETMTYVLKETQKISELRINCTKSEFLKNSWCENITQELDRRRRPA